VPQTYATTYAMIAPPWRTEWLRARVRGERMAMGMRLLIRV
jgi:hypothetical protein